MKINRKVVVFLIAVNILLGGGAISLKTYRLKHPPLETIKGDLILLAIQLKVGQGDSFLIVSPDQKVTLIDCGPAYETQTLVWDAGLRIILPTLRTLGLNRIDQIILTHHHDDHIGGVSSLVKRMPVGQVLNNGKVELSQAYYNLIQTLQRYKVPLKTLKRGDTLDLGQYVRAVVLSPDVSDVMEGTEEDHNDASLVLKINFRNFDMLLTGDIEASGERELCEFYGSGLRCDFLKVPHHGSKTSSSFAFLKLARPVVAGMSVGKGNSYGHPALEILKRYQALVRGRVFRTDEDGGILLISNGIECFAVTEKGTYRKLDIKN